jgi:hypothetical protein
MLLIFYRLEFSDQGKKISRIIYQKMPVMDDQLQCQLYIYRQMIGGIALIF